MNNDVNKWKNAFNNNIDNNVTTRQRTPTPVKNQFLERETLGISKQSKNLIPGWMNEWMNENFCKPSTMKQLVLVGKHMC